MTDLLLQLSNRGGAFRVAWGVSVPKPWRSIACVERDPELLNGFNMIEHLNNLTYTCRRKLRFSRWILKRKRNISVEWPRRWKTAAHAQRRVRSFCATQTVNHRQKMRIERNWSICASGICENVVQQDFVIILALPKPIGFNCFWLVDKKLLNPLKP